MDPTVADSWIINYINSNRSVFSNINFGIHLNEIVDVRMGSQTIITTNNNAKLRYQFDTSYDQTTTWETTRNL